MGIEITKDELNSAAKFFADSMYDPINITGDLATSSDDWFYDQNPSAEEIIARKDKQRTQAYFCYMRSDSTKVTDEELRQIRQYYTFEQETERPDMPDAQYMRTALEQELPSEIAKWESLYDSATTENERTKFSDKLAELRKQQDEYSAIISNLDSIDTANEKVREKNNQVENDVSKEQQLKKGIAYSRECVARGLAHAYNTQHDIYSFAIGCNWDTVNDDAKKLAAAEYQYFELYEKPRLANDPDKLAERQAYFDKMKEVYPDCDKYRIQFNNDSDFDLSRAKMVTVSYNNTNNSSKDSADSKAKMSDAEAKSSGTKSASNKSEYKSYSDMTDAEKREYVSDFDSKYASRKNDMSMDDSSYVAEKRDYLRCKQDLNMTLTNADKKWAIADFESTTPSISSTADANAYAAKKQLISRYKSELAEPQTKSASTNTVNMESKPHNSASKNPYEFTKPAREAGMTDAAYDNLCKQAEAEQISKINNEMADKVIRGDYGCGQERFEKLSAEGYNYSQVQEIVNQKMAVYNTQTQAKVEAEQSANALERSDAVLKRNNKTAAVSHDMSIDASNQATLARTKPHAETVKDSNTVYVDHAKASKLVTAPVNTNQRDNMYVENAAVVTGVANKVDNAAFAREIAGDVDNTEFSKQIAGKVDNSRFSGEVAAKVDNAAFSNGIASRVDNAAFSNDIAARVDNGSNHYVDNSVNKAMAAPIETKTNQDVLAKNTVSDKMARFERIEKQSSADSKSMTDLDYGD